MNDLQPITATDAELESYLHDADLPALLPALAHLVGDHTLLEESFRPLPPSPVADSLPQGGLDEATQRRARERALQTLIAYRDAGCPPPPPATSQEQLAQLRFIAGDLPETYLPLLLSELGLSRDEGAPEWTLDALASGRTNLRVVIIGAGMSGLAMAHWLSQAGVDYTILEKNCEVGGTWWENRYPGCRLDTSNFAYSYSFAQKADWTYQFSTRDEIHQYFSGVADEMKLRDQIWFETEVISADFEEASGQWHLVVGHPDAPPTTLVADVVISAVGQLNRPNIPAIPGKERFAGESFHTAEWRDDVSLDNKRVAVIGTGASAYQVIPEIAPEVAALTVFQRTPPWMMPTPTYHDQIPFGMRWLLVHIPQYHQWFRFMQFWNSLEGRRNFMVVDPEWTGEGSVSQLNDDVRSALTDHLAKQFGDRPDLLAEAVPSYPPYAKRILRDNGDWARTLHKEHVSLVTSAISRICEEGVVTADGRVHEADVLIWGTGFHASDFLQPMKIRGRGGRDLHEWWAGEPRAHLGITMPGFPNFFCLYGPNTNLVLNGSIILFSEAGVHYIMGCIEAMLRRDAQVIECREEPFEEFNAMIDAANLGMAWSAPGVNSWYKSRSGRVSQNWPLPIIDYWNLTRTPDPDHFDFTPRTSS